MQQGGSTAGYRTITRLAGAFLAVVLAQPVLAADPPAKKATSKAPAKVAPKAKPVLLTREQLRACMDEQDRVQQGVAKVKQDEATLEQARREVEQIDADIARRLAAMDPADAETKQALIEEESRRNERAEAYNVRLRALREQADSLTAQRKTWAERCANKDYDERDEIAIQLERKRSAGATK